MIHGPVRPLQAIGMMFHIFRTTPLEKKSVRQRTDLEDFIHALKGFTGVETRTQLLAASMAILCLVSTGFTVSSSLSRCEFRRMACSVAQSRTAL